MAHIPVLYFSQEYSSLLSCYVFPFLLFPTSICRVHSCIPFCVSLMFSNFSFMSYLSRFLRGVFPFMCLYMPWHIILFPSWSSPISGFHPPGLLQAWVISEALIGFLCFGRPPFSICRDSFCKLVNLWLVGLNPGVCAIIFYMWCVTSVLCWFYVVMSCKCHFSLGKSLSGFCYRCIQMAPFPIFSVSIPFLFCIVLHLPPGLPFFLVFYRLLPFSSPFWLWQLVVYQPRM